MTCGPCSARYLLWTGTHRNGIGQKIEAGAGCGPSAGAVEVVKPIAGVKDNMAAVSATMTACMVVPFLLGNTFR